MKKNFNYMSRQRKVILHHSAVSREVASEQFDAINNNHKKRFTKWRSKTGYYIAYHFLIEPDGSIRQARNIDEWGAHVHNREDNWHIGVCLAGNFNIELPTDAQNKSLYNLLQRLKEDEGIKEVLAHRTIQPNTACYGYNLNDDYGQNILEGNNYIKQKLFDRLNNKFILRPEANGELYYVNNDELVYLKTPQDMFEVLTKYQIAIGIGENDFKILNK